MIWVADCKPEFFLRPHNDARTQPIRLDQGFHEGDLINAHTQKKSGEFGQRFLTQLAAAVKIVTAGSITIARCFL